MKEKVV